MSANINNAATLQQLPNYSEHPDTYLRRLAAAPPSRANFAGLAGPVAASLVVVTPQVAQLYLQAAAHQLLAELNTTTSAGCSDNGAIAAAAAARDGGNNTNNKANNDDDTAAAAAGGNNNASTKNSTLDPHYMEMLHAVGQAVTKCPRHLISGTGVLNVLSSLQSHELSQQWPSDMSASSNHSGGSNMPSICVLTLAHVEFIQACVFAQEYDSAIVELERLAREYAGSSSIWWPRPDASNNMSVKDLMRYYHVRGTLHLMRHDFVWANRCFETCLSIPGSGKNGGGGGAAVSDIAIAAWKKWILLQCLMNVHVFGSRSAAAAAAAAAGSFATMPAATSTALKRFINRITATAKTMPGQPLSSQWNIGMTAGSSLAAAPFSLTNNNSFYSHQQREQQQQQDMDNMVMMMQQQQQAPSQGFVMPAPVANEVMAEPPAQQQHQDDVQAVAAGMHGMANPFAAPAAPPVAFAFSGDNMARQPMPAAPSSVNDSYNCQAYMALAQAFEHVDEPAMEKTMTRQNQAIFESDGNVKLATCLQKEYWMRRLVLDKARIYSSISLAELAVQVHGSTDQVTHVLQQLSESQYCPWNIQIVKDGDDNDIIQFDKVCAHAPDHAMAFQQQQELETLSRMIQQLHVSLATSSKYITAAKKGDFGGSTAGGSDLEDLLLGGPRGVEEL